jgi:hypothetical protein
MAQPIVSDVLDSADVSRAADGTALLTVHFRFPVNYVSHFPTSSGETLAISVRPAVFGKPEKDTPRRREALRPPRDAGIPLTDIAYDEEALWTPYLFLRFSEPVRFRVRPGHDGRSIIVEVPPPATPGSIEPGASPAAPE